MKAVIDLIPGTDDLVKIKCGDKFITWTADQFARHLEWIAEDIDCERQLRELKEKLKSIEWNSLRHIGPDSTGKLVYVSTCPACNFSQENGHGRDCWLEEIIKEDKQC